MIDAPVEPCMVSAGAESYEVLFVLDILHLGSVEWLVGLEVVADAAVFRLGWTIDRKHLLTRVEDDG
jgi:hypothetical protein